jgi:hypothetical protein
MINIKEKITVHNVFRAYVMILGVYVMILRVYMILNIKPS